MKRNILLALLTLIIIPLQAQELTLEKCRELALKNNEAIQKANIEVRQAKLDKQIATTSYLPKLSGNATGAYLTDKETDMGKLSFDGVYMAGFSIQQPIFMGGKIVATHRKAKIGQEMAKENQRLKRQQVISKTDNIYWNYVAVKEKVELLKQYILHLDSVYANTKVKVENQFSTESDLLRINSYISQAKYNLQKAENGLGICKMALCSHIGLPMDSPVFIQETIASIKSTVNESQIPSGTIFNRPEFTLLQHQVSANEQDVRITRSEFLPTLGLGLGYNWMGNIKYKMFSEDEAGNRKVNSGTFDTHTGSIMLSLSIPLFHFGEGIKKVKRAKLNVDIARLDMQEKQRQMEVEKEQAIRNLYDGKAMIKAAMISQNQAEENLRIMRIRYEEGYAILTDLMDAQNVWQEANFSVIEALTQYKVYETEYKYAIGILK